MRHIIFALQVAGMLIAAPLRAQEPLTSWLQGHASDAATLTVAPGTRALGEPVGYACPSIGRARAVIGAIPRGDDVSEADKYRQFADALSQNGCARTSGRFAPTAIHEARYIVCGEECWSHWTALEARDMRGVSVALIYDASLM